MISDVNSNLVSIQPINNLLALPSSGNGERAAKPTKKLSGREMDKKRQKGLCFWCDDKFVPGYRCNKRQLYSLTVDSEDIEIKEEMDEC